jgi:hypothetical protein
MSILINTIVLHVLIFTGYAIFGIKSMYNLNVQEYNTYAIQTCEITSIDFKSVDFNMKEYDYCIKLKNGNMETCYNMKATFIFDVGSFIPCWSKSDGTNLRAYEPYYPYFEIFIMLVLSIILAFSILFLTIFNTFYIRCELLKTE